MTIVAFCFDGKFHTRIVPPGDSVTGETYLDFIRSLNHHFSRLRQHNLQLHEMVLQHDNARPHIKACVKQYIASKGVTLLKQAQYSPDTNMLDRWMFSVFEQRRKNTSFSNEDEVQIFLTTFMRSLALEAHQYQHLKWKEDLQAIIVRLAIYLAIPNILLFIH